LGNLSVQKNLGQEKKQKLKKNNRARKNERARLRNSDDPAARNSAKSFEAEHHLIFFVWFQDQRKREAHLEKERERKRAAYAKKKLALEELKQRHKAS